MSANVKVTKSDPPETTEVLAEAIVRIGEGFERLKESGLNQRAIVVLLNDATKIGKRDITVVLDVLPRLAGYYCRKDES